MSYTLNKKDFEKALDALNGLVPILKERFFLGDSELEIIQRVIDEYEIHFVDDIENLYDELEELRENCDEN